MGLVDILMISDVDCLKKSAKVYVWDRIGMWYKDKSITYNLIFCSQNIACHESIMVQSWSYVKAYFAIQVPRCTLRSFWYTITLDPGGSIGDLLRS